MIETSIKNLYLKPLTSDNLNDYYKLVDANRLHLSQHGDFSELKHATRITLSKELNDKKNKNIKFGIWLDNTLIGRIDLSPRKKGEFVIGYWLGRDFTGHGYATQSAKALMEFAKISLRAKDIYAGVTKVNKASIKILEHLGFTYIKDKGKSILYHKSII